MKNLYGFHGALELKNGTKPQLGLISAPTALDNKAAGRLDATEGVAGTWVPAPTVMKYS